MFQLNNGVYIVEIAQNEGVIKEAQLISRYTVNTWQEGRSLTEKKLNTQNGKRAELAVEKILHNYKIIYLPYDNFRTDLFKKHAPFDGLIFDELKKIEPYLEKINIEITNGEYGKLSPETLNELINEKIFPVEIKSTQVSERHMPSTLNLNQKDHETILTEISNNICKKDDFLAYPYFFRSSDEIGNLTWYFNKVNSKENFEFKSISSLLEFERVNQAFFHIRVYQQENTFFVLRFISRDDFFAQNNLSIKRMYKKGKSEKAIYFTKKIMFGSKMENIMKYLEV